ncbi:uncharacterized protein RBU33_008612 [Hipposideros larvatus]
MVSHIHPRDIPRGRRSRLSLGWAQGPEGRAGTQAMRTARQRETRSGGGAGPVWHLGLRAGPQRPGRPPSQSGASPGSRRREPRQVPAGEPGRRREERPAEARGRRRFQRHFRVLLPGGVDSDGRLGESPVQDREEERQVLLSLGLGALGPAFMCHRRQDVRARQMTLRILMKNGLRRRKGPVH